MVDILVIIFSLFCFIFVSNILLSLYSGIKYLRYGNKTYVEILDKKYKDGNTLRYYVSRYKRNDEVCAIKEKWINA